MTAEAEKNWVEEIGKPSYESIAEMVACLEADRDRLEELREERDGWEPEECDEGSGKLRPCATWAEQNPEDAEELAALEKAVTLDGEELDEDKARERIQEDALSCLVRSGWYSPGDSDADKAPSDFELLLTTGGPAVRIRGELGANMEPSRAWLEVQDWGKPWTQYFQASQETLLTYARCFYFGE